MFCVQISKRDTGSSGDVRGYDRGGSTIFMSERYAKEKKE